MLKTKKKSFKSASKTAVIKEVIAPPKKIAKVDPVAQFVQDMDNWRQAKDAKKEHTFHGVVDDKAVFMRSRGTEVLELIVDGNTSSLGAGATPDEFKECLRIALS
jgi:hypothetical protein